MDIVEWIMRKYLTLIIASLFMPSLMFGMAAMAQTPYEQSQAVDEGDAQRLGLENSANIDSIRRPTIEEARRTCSGAINKRTEDTCISCLTHRTREDKFCQKPWHAWLNGTQLFDTKEGRSTMRFRKR
jgi:hypothetical protein